MGIDLASLRSELRVHLGDLDTDDLSNPDADLLLNRAFWELLNKFPFREKECTVTFTVDEDESFVSLPTLFEAIRKLSIQDNDTSEWTPLTRMDIDEHEDTADDNTDSKGEPVRYLRDRNGIRLQSEQGGAPDQTYTLRMKYWITLADLDDSNSDVNLPDVWHELLLYGGLWRGFIRLSDLEKAREIRNVQVGLINSTTLVETKEQADSSLAGVELPKELTTI